MKTLILALSLVSLSVHAQISGSNLSKAIQKLEHKMEDISVDTTVDETGTYVGFPSGVICKVTSLTANKAKFTCAAGFGLVTKYSFKLN